MIGEKYSVEITALGKEGEGIGRVDGLAFFVDGAIPGDYVLAEVVQFKKNFARGRLLEVFRPSPDRIKPACPYADECGGCSLQHLDYEAQVRYKTELLRNSLERIGGLKNPLIIGTIGMENPWRYRNKAEYAVFHNTSGIKPAIGFYKKKSHDVVDCGTCLLQTGKVEQIIRALRPFAASNVWLESVTIKTAFGSGEIMLVLAASPGNNNVDLEQIRDGLIKALENPGEDWDDSKGYEIKSLILKLNNNEHLLAGKSVIRDKLMGLDFEVSADSFFQVNPTQTEKLYSKVVEFAGLTGKETVFDLYCGVGTIGLILSKHAGRVVGVESVKKAVLDANRNATINGIVNAEFICGRAEEVLPELMEREHEAGQKYNADLIVLDPPRAGCHPTLLNAVAAARPFKIIYVSCDPPTLARDIKVLTQHGYKLERAQAIDMFPHTNHVETVVLITRV